MNPKPRFVFDNNAIVSALLFADSVPGRAFFAALDRGEILVSGETFAELTNVLARPKFDRYLTRQEREQFLVRLLLAASLIEIAERITSSRDPKDDKFLELAISGAAAYIITGDQDLLALNPFRGIPILTPAQFLAAMLSPGAPHES